MSQLVAVVFGATGNVGGPVAKTLHSNGYEVILIGKSAEKLQQFKASAFSSSAQNETVHVVSDVDVSSMDSTRDAAEKVQQLLGTERKINVLIFSVSSALYNNPEDPLATIDGNSVTQAFGAKLGGAANVLKYFVPLAAPNANYLLTGGGSGTKVFLPALVVAGATNAAILSFVKGMSAVLNKKYNGMQLTAVQICALVDKPGPMGITGEELAKEYLRFVRRDAQSYKDEEYIMPQKQQ